MVIPEPLRRLLVSLDPNRTMRPHKLLLLLRALRPSTLQPAREPRSHDDNIAVSEVETLPFRDGLEVGHCYLVRIER